MNTPHLCLYPRQRGAITGQVLTEAEVIEMDHQARAEHLARRIGRIVTPISLAGPMGEAVSFPARDNKLIFFPLKACISPDTPPRGGAPAAAMPRAA